jgi:hypothetical protein
MDWDRVEGNWKQFKGRVKEKWGNPPMTIWTALPVVAINWRD